MPDWLTVGGLVAAASTPAGRRLFETLAAGMGTVYRPIGTIAQAKADAVAKRIATQAEWELEDELAERIRARELRRESNIDAIAAQALQRLRPVPHHRPVDPDWTAQFLRVAGDTSNAEMQSFWARLLAGEIDEPGSVSKRAVSTLGVMSHADAVAVQHLSGVAWHTPDKAIALIPFSRSFTEWGLGDNTLINLQSLGLTSGFVEGLGSSFDMSAGEEILFAYHDRRFRIHNPRNHAISLGDFVAISPVGAELCRLAETSSRQDYLQTLLGDLDRRGLAVTEL